MLVLYLLSSRAYTLDSFRPKVLMSHVLTYVVDVIAPNSNKIRTMT